MSRPEKYLLIVTTVLCVYSLTKMIQGLDFQAGNMVLEKLVEDLDKILK